MIHETKTTISTDGKIPAPDADAIKTAWVNMAGKSVTIITAPSVADYFNIVPFADLKQHIERLQVIAETNVDENDAPAVLDLLNELTTWLSYAGQLVASAEYYEKRNLELLMLADPPNHITGAMEKKSFRDAQNAEFAYIARAADRLYSAMVHRSDALRSFVSYQKSLMNFTT